MFDLTYMTAQSIFAMRLRCAWRLVTWPYYSTVVFWYKFVFCLKAVVCLRRHCMLQHPPCILNLCILLIHVRYFPLSSTIASVEEGAEVGKLVALITVTDNDLKRQPDGQIMLSIVEGNDLGHFALVNTAGVNLGQLQVFVAPQFY